MKLKKIVIIGVYFGQFPNNYRLWLESCKYNSTIDFKVFTDQTYESTIDNVEYIKMDLYQFDSLIKQKMGKTFGLNYAYKCCDFKPVYGIILEDYIKDYDFWGHCDFDLIFGDLRSFLTESILNKYDKILPLGHLSLYRNNKIVNNRYKEPGSKCGDYQKVYTTSKTFFFDETGGIAQIYYKNKYPFYDKRIFADISIIHKRFTLALGDKNYNYQVFYWENGHVYRAFLEDGHIKTDEFIYIHFKQRKYLHIKFNDKNPVSFYICDDGFIKKNRGVPTLNDIKKYNPYPGKFVESYDNVKHKIYNIFYYNKLRAINLFEKIFKRK